MDLTDSRQESARDRWVQQQMEEAMRYLPTDLEVLPSPLLLEPMECEASQRQKVRKGCSFPPPQLRRSLPAPVPAAKPSSSSRRKKRWRGAPSCGSAAEEVVSLPADVRAAASGPASLSATALSARLAAPSPMPSSLAPVRCFGTTPDELEERLRFYACQIKSFRRTSLMYSSPELMEKIMQMERDYKTTVRQFYCRPPPSWPGLQGAATEQPTPGLQGAATEQPTPGLRSGAAAQSTSGLRSVAAKQPTSGLQGAAAEQPTSGLQGAAAEQPTSGPQPDTKSASSSSTRRRGRRKRSTSAHVTEGVGDASAPANATEGLGNASASAHATEGLCDASAATPSLQAFQGFSGELVPEPCDEGFKEEAPPDPVSEGFKEQLVLILASEPRDEGFQEEVPPDPFHVIEGFKEHLVLILASEAIDEGFEEEAPPDPVSGEFKEQLFLTGFQMDFRTLVEKKQQTNKRSFLNFCPSQTYSSNQLLVHIV
ncbi:hypothetical protein CRENBAI_021378 [Crenichthys baileyi]|uniref:Uncharacterized protein n=1 Tax=Crenichthys baileyi TaxID=28760 RepID=A0AAV9RA14_9TELE